MANRLIGYAARFDKLSQPLGDFVEVIRRGAFQRELDNGEEIYAIHHHNWSQVLGRTGNGTLKLEEDHRGLKFELLLPATTLGKDTHALVRRQDIAGMSFAFDIRGAAGERWSEGPNGLLLRELLDLYLFEVSTTAVPAYLDTDVQARMALQAPDNDHHAMIATHNRIGREVHLVSTGTPRGNGTKPGKRPRTKAENLERHRRLRPEEANQPCKRRRKSKPLSQAQLLARHKRLKPVA